jgi:hypothetical protein
MFRLLMLTMLASAVAISSALADGVGLEGTWRIGNYQVAIKNSEDKNTAPKATLTVTQDGRTIYSMQNAALWLNPAGFFEHPGKMTYEDSLKPSRIGADVLKLGAPTVVVWGFSMGAHCCSDLTILTFAPAFRAMPTLHLLDSENVDFRAVSGHTALAISASDWTFAYWRAPFAFSPAAPVMLSYDAKAGRYEADPDLMRTPAPSLGKLNDDAAAAKTAFLKSRDDGNEFAPFDVTWSVLRLIYGGHIDAARHFLETAWVGSPKERDDYWRDLTTCQMRLSPFWPAVAKVNGLQPDKPAGNCPRR